MHFDLDWKIIYGRYFTNSFGGTQGTHISYIQYFICFCSVFNALGDVLDWDTFHKLEITTSQNKTKIYTAHLIAYVELAVVFHKYRIK